MKILNSQIVKYIGMAAVLALASTNAFANGLQVTEGKAVTTKVGTERNYKITGQAYMFRIPSGKTIVDLHVEGLHPNEKYPVH